jgi:integrase/recombinase XerD
MRIGEVLELRHNDIAAAERQVILMRRDNAIGAGTKSPTTRKIPVSVDLIRPSRLPAYQVRDLDGDYVVGILRGPSARASTGLRRKAGIDFDAHRLWHTAPTRLLR